MVSVVSRCRSGITCRHMSEASDLTSMPCPAEGPQWWSASESGHVLWGMCEKSSAYSHRARWCAFSSSSYSFLDWESLPLRIGFAPATLYIAVPDGSFEKWALRYLCLQFRLTVILPVKEPTCQLPSIKSCHFLASIVFSRGEQHHRQRPYQEGYCHGRCEGGCLPKSSSQNPEARLSMGRCRRWWQGGKEQIQ